MPSRGLVADGEPALRGALLRVKAPEEAGLGDDVGEVDVGAAPHAREQPVELAAAHQARRDQHGPDPRPLRAATAAAHSACSRLIRPLGLQHFPQPFHGDQDLDARPGRTSGPARIDPSA